ncbi:hypothetical protein GJU40_10560 [Bacillus lacus]|uniref:Uncharacterized protein n=1 Tax=Metabacillus lacus TaxID=1983721 RepID=A0A7X2IZD1_9BACI|nr:SA1362 family protein [Metabacillus lacus]MRX72588.1 hypothetical protein [Metabacillus lacus]
MKRKLNPFFLAIAILGAIGFVYMIVERPSELVMIFATYAVIGLLIFFAVRFFLGKRLGGADKNFTKAVKQSKRRYTDGPQTQAKSSQSKKPTNIASKKKRQQPSHLTVIEGKKGKKKNRAFF